MVSNTPARNAQNANTPRPDDINGANARY